MTTNVMKKASETGEEQVVLTLNIARNVSNFHKWRESLIDKCKPDLGEVTNVLKPTICSVCGASTR